MILKVIIDLNLISSFAVLVSVGTEPNEGYQSQQQREQ